MPPERFFVPPGRRPSRRAKSVGRAIGPGRSCAADQSNRVWRRRRSRGRADTAERLSIRGALDARRMPRRPAQLHLPADGEESLLPVIEVDGEHPSETLLRLHLPELFGLRSITVAVGGLASSIEARAREHAGRLAELSSLNEAPLGPGASCSRIASRESKASLPPSRAAGSEHRAGSASRSAMRG